MTVNPPVSCARRRSPKPLTRASDAAFVEGVGSPRARSVDITRTACYTWQDAEEMIPPVPRSWNIFVTVFLCRFRGGFV